MLKRSNRIAHSLLFFSSAVLLCACTSDKEVSFKSGGLTNTFVEGKSAIPGNFPLPIYPGAEATGSVSSQSDKDQEDAKFLILSASDDYVKVGNFYRDSLKSSGWKIESVQNLPNLINIAASKANLDASVMIATDQGKKTSISMSVSKGTGQDKELGSKDANYSPDKMTPPTD